MTHPFTVLKSCGPKLVPFFKTCAIFFVLYGERSVSDSFIFCIIKCLPIISLIIFVLLHGMNLTNYYTYSRRIIAGLVFSLLGDAFLVWSSQYFEAGLAMFAVAHVLYAMAFGWKPPNFKTGVVVGLLSLVVFQFVTFEISGIMNYFIGLYVVVIGVMGWRAIARSQILTQPYEKIPWTKLVGGLGSMLFMISDTVIAIDKFRFRVPFSHTIIMTTYYAAQLGIALSVVDSQVDVIMEETSKANGHVIQSMLQETRKTSNGQIKALKAE